MARIGYKSSGLNSHNDTARDITKAKFKHRMGMLHRFGHNSQHRKIYLEKFQWSMTWTEYKKQYGKNPKPKKRKYGRRKNKTVGTTAN